MLSGKPGRITKAIGTDASTGGTFVPLVTQLKYALEIACKYLSGRCVKWLVMESFVQADDGHYHVYTASSSHLAAAASTAELMNDQPASDNVGVSGCNIGLYKTTVCISATFTGVAD